MFLFPTSKFDWSCLQWEPLATLLISSLPHHFPLPLFTCMLTYISTLWREPLLFNFALPAWTEATKTWKKLRHVGPLNQAHNSCRARANASQPWLRQAERLTAEALKILLKSNITTWKPFKARESCKLGCVTEHTFISKCRWFAVNYINHAPHSLCCRSIRSVAE